MKEQKLAILKNRLDPHKNADKEWFLSLLDGERQLAYEGEHLQNVLAALKAFYVSRYLEAIAGLEEEARQIKAKENYSAEDYRQLIEINARIVEQKRRLNGYKCFFSEPYFARMDVVDDSEGYNSYYIGRKGDVNLEIVDWRAPLAVRYYQKSRVTFSFGEYEYKTVLRRALSVKNGKVNEFKNEYLSVRDYLTPEEIGGRDEEILFDPFLRQIISSRKDDVHIRDIIRTIQEQQFDVITLPERENFVLQGCAGSGKTMIMLHRLSYLMYNNEKLRPRDVLVVTPSDSFNDFIDELSQALELQRVSTVTLQNYFFRALEGEGIRLAELLSDKKEETEYLQYLYSPRFVSDVKKQIAKMLDGIYGMFTSKECRTEAEKLLKSLKSKREKYDKIKNASIRVRRAVLGEMKEKKEGSFYFTKPFRSLMSVAVRIEDFLSFALEGDIKSPDYFFRQFVEFYRGARFCAKHADKVLEEAEGDLKALIDIVDREIADLKRYRVCRGEEEVLTYADRIAHRQELKEEAAETIGLVRSMAAGNDLLTEFAEILRLSRYCSGLGKCENTVDVSRWLYRETVKKYKEKFGMKGIYPSDGYAICRVLSEAGRKLSPRYGYVFVDEGQDVSEGEYELIKSMNPNAALNVFGDLKQRITPFRGVDGWSGVAENVYELNRNYRNTNEIVDYVSTVLEVDMLAIGFHGEPVIKIPPRKINAFFREKQGLKAVIVPEHRISEFDKRGFRLLRKSGKVSKKGINVMTVFESKGLEFSSVAVLAEGMTENEQYIACTRALKELAIVTEEETK